MRSSFYAIMSQCEFGDWIGIGILIAGGSFSLTFLALGIILIARFLLASARRGSTSVS